MTIDRRLVDIQQTADDREPTDVYRDQMAVIVDNLMFGYLRDPQQTDAMLRRDGLTKAADQLVDIFGPEWWMKL
ncbi:hypothetical protein ACIP8U_00270 [Streptomyces pseudovenezuelae]|uniref:hypothetical protein n=1 Tax=Streptomyces pseudovenezuelae TaxID=67350 RepID=UPI0037FDBD2C